MNPYVFGSLSIRIVTITEDKHTRKPTKDTCQCNKVNLDSSSFFMYNMGYWIKVGPLLVWFGVPIPWTVPVRRLVLKIEVYVARRVVWDKNETNLFIRVNRTIKEFMCKRDLVLKNWTLYVPRCTYSKSSVYWKILS